MRFRTGLGCLSIVLVGCGGKVAVDGATDGATTVPTCAGVDLHTDPHHCGWCGHDCGGATCSNSVCTPTAIATSLASPNSIALDDAHAYWASTAPATVKRARKEGGAETVYFDSGTGGTGPVIGGDDAKDVAVDPLRVFWLGTNPMGSYDGFFALKEGGGGGRSGLVGGVDLALATCGADVWISGNPHSLWRQSLTPPSVSTFDIDAMAIDLACSGSSLAWLDLGRGLDVETGAGRAMRFSGASGGADFVLAEGIARPAQLTIRDDTIYFTSGRYTGLIQSVPLKGGPTTTIASGQLDPQGIAVDDRWVYWVTVGQLPAEGTVMRSDKRLGGSPQFLAFGQRRPLAIAVDDRYVYWVSQGDAGKANGGVYRVPK